MTASTTTAADEIGDSEAQVADPAVRVLAFAPTAWDTA